MAGRFESEHPGHELRSTTDRDTGAFCAVKPPCPAQTAKIRPKLRKSGPNRKNLSSSIKSLDILSVLKPHALLSCPMKPSKTSNDHGASNRKGSIAKARRRKPSWPGSANSRPSAPARSAGCHAPPGCDEQIGGHEAGVDQVLAGTRLARPTPPGSAGTVHLVHRGGGRRHMRDQVGPVLVIAMWDPAVTPAPAHVMVVPNE
jgi:hypothetical protein